LAELEVIVARIEGRGREVEAELNSLRENAIGPEDVAQKLAEFEGVWEVLHSAEQTLLVQLVIAAATCTDHDEVQFEFNLHKPLNLASC
jgi:hypothetical protein